MHEWHDFFVAQVGASAALVGLLFVAVSINLSRILQFPALPARAMEALLILVCLFSVSTCALVPDLQARTYGVLFAAIGLMTWVMLIRALIYTRGSGYETLLRRLMNQLPPPPFVAGGVLIATGHPAGAYWLLAGTLLSILSSMFYAWVLLIEIQRCRVRRKLTYPDRNCFRPSSTEESLRLPSLSNAFAARATAMRPPNQGCMPSVRSTGSQAAWLSTVPKGPEEAPMMATGRAPKTRLMSAGGRDSQSMVFLNTPGRLLLYSGVAKSSASALTTASFRALTEGGMPCDSTSAS
jgi:hypothetical protein